MSNPPVELAAAAVLQAAVAQGVDGGRSWPSTLLVDDVFDQVVQVATRDRLLGTLAQAAVAGELPVSDEQFGRLAAEHAVWMAYALDIERLLIQVVDAYAEKQIEFRVLKGAALGRLIYPDPAWRITSDLDLLVPSGQFDAAVKSGIEDLGGVQPVPELRPGFDRDFGKEALIRVGRIELDVHRTFVAGPFGLLIDLDALFGDAQQITIGDRIVTTLGPSLQFLHACYNTALGNHPVRLSSVRDMLLCLERLDVDMALVYSLAAQWRATAVIQKAAELAIDVVGPKAGWRLIETRRLPVPRRDAWLLRSYFTEARSYSRPLSSLVVIPGIGRRLRYLRAIAAPSRKYLDSRGWDERSHVLRAKQRFQRRD